MTTLPRRSALVAVLFGHLSFAGTLAAQAATSSQTPPSPSACDCPAIFDAAVRRLQTDYVAYAMEVRDRREREWAQHVASLRPRAAGRPAVDCSWLLRELLSFFRDGHLMMIDMPLADSAGRASRLASRPRHALGAGSRWLAAGTRTSIGDGAAPDEIEGVWKGPGYRIAVMRDSARPARARGVLLADAAGGWRAGQERAEFVQVNGQWRATVWDEFAQPRSSLVVTSRGALMRMAPLLWVRATDVAESFVDTTDARRPRVVYPDDSTAVISVVTFDPGYGKALRALIDTEWSTLRARRTVIIDLRGNEGGSSLEVAPLLPWLLPRDERSPRGPAVADQRAAMVLSSPRTIGFWERAGWAPRGLVERMRNAPGQLVAFDPAAAAPALPRAGRLAETAHVYVLIDRATVSAAEQVVLWARMAGRARIIGEPSGGSIDYQSAWLSRVACGSMGQVLSLPVIAASAQLPTGGHNARGIQPDLAIPTHGRWLTRWRAPQSDSLQLATASRVIAFLRAGQPDSAVARFSESLRREIPATRLRDIWASLEASLGAPVRVDSARRNQAEFAVAIVFRAVTIDASMRIDASGQVQSLALRPRAGPQGEAAFAQADFTRADSAFRRIVAATPDAVALTRLGDIALLHNRPTDAAEWFARAVAIDPRSTEALLGLAEAQRRLHRYSAAASTLQQAGRHAAAQKFAAFADAAPYRLHFPDGVSVVRVAFVRTDPLPVVSLRVNGSAPAHFIIDTGAGETILDPEFAAQVGAVQFGSDRNVFAGGRAADVLHGRVDSLILGDLRISAVPVRIQPTRPFALAAGGLKVDGVLGNGVFQELRATLDYPAGALLLRPKGAAVSVSAQASVVPILMAGDHLVLAWGRVGVADSTVLLIDTGLVGATFVAPDTVFRANGIPADAGEEVVGIGGGGSVTARIVNVPAVSLGPLRRENIRAMMGVFPPTLEWRYGFPIRGLVSHDFLRQYAVSWEFDRMRMILEPVT